MNIRSFIFVSVFFACFFVMSVFIDKQEVESQAFAPAFGGLTACIPCPCSGNVMCTLGPPVPAVVAMWPAPAGTIGAPGMYAFWMMTGGVWWLGTGSPGGVCSIPAPHSGCITLPAEYTGIGIGTSL